MLRLLTGFSVILHTLSTCGHGGTFDSNGVRIHFYDQGTGEPVVLVHGALGSGADWNELGVTQALADAGFRALAIDTRGHGQSEKPHDPKEYGLEMSHDIARLLDHLGIRKAHVIGYSQGALVANRFRAHHPDRVLTAILGGDAALNRKSVWVARANEFADGLLNGDIGPIVYALTPPGQSPPTQEELDKLYKEYSSRNDMKAFAASTRAQGFPDSIDELRANKIPMLAIIGEADPNRADVDWTARVMPNLAVVVIPGADHGAALRHPMFVKEVLTFLLQHRKSTCGQTPGTGTEKTMPRE